MALMLRLRDYGTRPSDGANRYVDAARAVRDKTPRMITNECEAKQPCVFGALLPTLDTLQRQAYKEINLKGVTAVSSCLPTDLTLMVLQIAMVAEEVPLDPRVYFDAKLTAEMKCDRPILHEFRVLDAWKGGDRAMGLF
jgi:hypothetical protein